MVFDKSIFWQSNIWQSECFPILFPPFSIIDKNCLTSNDCHDLWRLTPTPLLMLFTCKYTGTRLMWSLVMLTFGLCDQLVSL
jgi:hypothetical protein